MSSPAAAATHAAEGWRVRCCYEPLLTQIDVDNNAATHQTVHLALRANTLEDHSVVRLAPQGGADRASVPLMLLAHFPGTRTNRVNTIYLGLWDTGAPPDIKVGRLKIIAQRTTYWIMEPSPGTTVQ